ncbi:MAG TPA: SUMF1/EgtB/PvdO family nonheme iron enzyme [Verrucomicrobiae bacterium]|nr:SUMF1/EgtB/PvdO family nonheme iron enzyme [Verrucomicrobiae bacterium]
MMRATGRFYVVVILLAHGTLLAQGDGAMNASEKSRIARILTPVAEAEAKKQKAVEGLVGKYVADLKSAEIEVARSGDLEAVRAIRAEREAWEKGESAPGFDAAGKRVLAKVATLRKKLDAEIQALEKETQRLLEQEKAKAIRALDAMKVELTRATRIDAALELDKQIDELKSGSLDVARAAADRAGESGAGTFRSGDTTSNPSEATKDRPFINSLGMPFVPIKGTRVLFCIWETRISDFKTYLLLGLGRHGWSSSPAFRQEPDHPMVVVTWDDANAFCAWLSKQEGHEYRLPTDEEWDRAVGRGKYPWGEDWPPKKSVENIRGDECSVNSPAEASARTSISYKDDHPNTAPVGSYMANKAGLYDMGGNVQEWVQDSYTEAVFKKHKEGGGFNFGPETMADIKKGNICRVLRGGYFGSAGVRSSYRGAQQASERSATVGFRCVLVLPSP